MRADTEHPVVVWYTSTRGQYVEGMDILSLNPRFLDRYIKVRAVCPVCCEPDLPPIRNSVCGTNGCPRVSPCPRAALHCHDAAPSVTCCQLPFVVSHVQSTLKAALEVNRMDLGRNWKELKSEQGIEIIKKVEGFAMMRSQRLVPVDPVRSIYPFPRHSSSFQMLC